MMTLKRKRILIVDDDKGFTSVLGLALRRLGGYVTREENHGGRTVLAAREFNPDVILLDVVMPDRDGGDVANDLRDDEQTRHIPVIYLTSLVDGEEAPL